MKRNREGVHLTSTSPNFFLARSQTKNKVQGLFPPNFNTSSIADASAAAAQNKKQYETLIKEEEK